MEKKIMTVLTPDFYSGFHCVAGGCRASCCVHPWNIYINKKNYKELRRLREPKWLADNFGSYIKRNDNSNMDGSYALTVYNERGCALQTVDGLCRLQAELGAQYLSETCNSYPRQDNYLLILRSGNMTVCREKCLTLSCEEVARMLLHKAEPIRFMLSEEEYTRDSISNGRRPTNNLVKDDGTRPILEHYNLIRAISTAVLQNRDYTIEQRIILLAVYLDKLSQAEKAETTDSIPAMTDNFVTAVDERLYERLFSATPIPAVTVLLTNFATAYAFSRGTETDIVKRCNDGISTIDYDVRAESYRQFMGDKEYFVEHLLITELFGKALPFKSNRSIDDCLQYLVSIFAVFRFMLGSYLGASHTLTEVEFIDFVAYFGKTVLHSTGSFDTNIALLKINNMDTLAYMVAIIIG